MALIMGTGGDDSIVGGPGDDEIESEFGRDTFIGGAGNDQLSQWGGPSALLDGGEGADTLQAVFGTNPGAATLFGGAGDDHIITAAPTAIVDAGAGADLVEVLWGTVTLTLGTGADLFRVLPYNPARPMTVTDFQTGPGGDVVRLDEEFLLGWDGASNLFAVGYYRLVQRGADTVLQLDRDGAAGSGHTFADLALFQNAVLASFTNDNVHRWALNGVQPDGFVGTAAGDSFAGTASSEVLDGRGGDDTLNGRAGDDSLFGGEGDDRLIGGSGSNFLRGGDGNDVLTAGEAAFNDLHGNVGNDSVWGGTGGDWVVGGQGNDQLGGGDGGDVVLGNLGNDTQYGDGGNDVVRGGQGSDSLSGGYGDDWMSGDRGADTISGGLGADVFHTFAGVGLDRITDFNAGEGDRLNVLAGTSYTVRQEGADTIVDLGNGDHVVLAGVQLAALPAGWLFVS